MQPDLKLPLFFDGAFGTYYFESTGDDMPCEQANLKAPAVVEQIHMEYLQAGAKAIKTNTFHANPVQIPDGAQLKAILEAGYEIASRAAKKYGAHVFADIGPMEGDNARKAYCETASLFLACGARAFLFETQTAFRPLLPALEQIRAEQPDAVIFISFAVSQDGYTRRGLHYRALLDAAFACEQVDAAGLNCVCGPSHMQSLTAALPQYEKPLLAMPNAGYPASFHGRLLFEDNAAYFAQRLAQTYLAGADILGGCCGTTPAHIRLGMDAVLENAQKPRLQKQPVHAKTAVRKACSLGHKLVAVELDPPQGPDSEKLIAAAMRVGQEGGDLITIADSPLARPRADSLMTAARVRRETGLPAMPHLCCRDRNRIAMKGSLIGAAMEGVDHVLVITGDRPADGVGGVFQFNSYHLIEYIAGLNSDIFAQNPFIIAGALNVNAANFSAELERAQKKLQRGASMLLTQPIFSEQAVANFHLAAKTLECTLLAGILPVASYKNALFLQNEVSGIEIPQQVLLQLQNTPPEQVADISVTYSAEIVSKVYDVADGFYIMTPLGKIEIVCGLLRAIRGKEFRNGEQKQ